MPDAWGLVLLSFFLNHFMLLPEKISLDFSLTPQTKSFDKRGNRLDWKREIPHEKFLTRNKICLLKALGLVLFLWNPRVHSKKLVETLGIHMF